MSNEEKYLEYLKRATADLRDASRRLRTWRGEREPIAIVGMACRFPGGVRSPEDLWHLSFPAAMASPAFPTDRGWDLDALAPGPAAAADRAGATHPVASSTTPASFDAGFFGISPREALHHGPAAAAAAGDRLGGVRAGGYRPAALRAARPACSSARNVPDYRRPGAGPERSSRATSVPATRPASLSGRLSYTFGLEGPAVTVDTACSSSLVALHLAAQALRSGECAIALAGGVTVMSTPRHLRRVHPAARPRLGRPVQVVRRGGRRHGWGEGAGVLLVERLSDARRGATRSSPWCVARL